jgi:hypothetical protein
MKILGRAQQAIANRVKQYIVHGWHMACCSLNTMY